MELTPEQEGNIVKAVYDEFHNNLAGKRDLDTQIWINDHNFEFWKNADSVLQHLERLRKKHYVDAAAFHNYSDAPAMFMTSLHERHPEVDIQFTEHSEWGVSGMFNIQSYFRNWSRSYMYWVAMTTSKLDEHNQSPYNRIGELSPTLLIEKEDGSPDWYVTPEYYLLSQFARFIRPGARRIRCEEGSVDKVSFVAFRNIDGRVVVITVNQTDYGQKFTLSCRQKFVTDTIPAKTIGTYIWQD
jgi:O-glycosyl hydrolase